MQCEEELLARSSSVFLSVPTLRPASAAENPKGTIRGFEKVLARNLLFFSYHARARFDIPKAWRLGGGFCDHYSFRKKRVFSSSFLLYKMLWGA
jgi:hypothetical protein